MTPLFVHFLEAPMTLNIPSDVGRCLSVISKNALLEELNMITQSFCDVHTQGKHAHCR